MQDHVPLCVKGETVFHRSKPAKVAQNALVQDYLRGDCRDVTIFCFIDIKMSAKKYIIYMMKTSTQLSPLLCSLNHLKARGCLMHLQRQARHRSHCLPRMV